MPSQVYRCRNPEHPDFEVSVPIKDDVPQFQHCPKCGNASSWLPSAPNFIGGPTTGARKE
ncbi:hypothetical protein LCGC14_1765130 [marine sediment metagenome]|uniref:Uncharacterized protein n=1 Tax=marine sediment metagenome TaxID=412755 RepID=A0A0F9JZM1_9ZZZZ